MSARPPQPAQTFWVDVHDHLPDSDTTVLIHAPSADEPVWLGYHDGETWLTVDGSISAQVIAWADLPEPPRKGAA